MITAELRKEIERELGKKLVAAAPLSAANNAQIYRLGLDGGASVVAKVSARGLELEAFMLRYLRSKSALPVPTVYYSNDHLILMEYVPTDYSADDRGHRHAAEVLAALHDIHAPQYGFERDTLIGGLVQPNAQSSDWVSFFAEHRLLHMARAAFDEGKIEKKMMAQVEKLAGKLGGYIVRPQKPSLIHGDIWGGNILFARGRVAAFVDPAVYYADAEVELAFIRLFGTLNESFFMRYNDLHPIHPGFEDVRAPIYGVYPLLVHTRLFGTSYARKVQKVLDRFA